VVIVTARLEDGRSVLLGVLPDRVKNTIVAFLCTIRARLQATIQAELDMGLCPTGVKVGGDELAAINLAMADFHGDWKYRVCPARKKK
jgi:hypothetical protein